MARINSFVSIISSVYFKTIILFSLTSSVDDLYVSNKERNCLNSFVLDGDARYLYIRLQKHFVEAYTAFVIIKVFFEKKAWLLSCLWHPKISFHIKLFQMHNDYLMVKIKMPNEKLRKKSGKNRKKTRIETENGIRTKRNDVSSVFFIIKSTYTLRWTYVHGFAFLFLFVINKRTTKSLCWNLS